MNETLTHDRSHQGAQNSHGHFYNRRTRAALQPPLRAMFLLTITLELIDIER